MQLLHEFFNGVWSIVRPAHIFIRCNMNLAVILHGFVICSCYMNFSMTCSPLSGLHIFALRESSTLTYQEFDQHYLSKSVSLSVRPAHIFSIYFVQSGQTLVSGLLKTNTIIISCVLVRSGQHEVKLNHFHRLPASKQKYKKSNRILTIQRESLFLQQKTISLT